VIEGTISQIHEPTLPYAVKLAFALIVGLGVYYYLLASGRGPTHREAVTGAQKMSSPP
jgi:hypothetical protein